MIPLLGVSGLAVVPPGKLASHHDFLRLFFHHLHYNLTGFQGVPSICCKVDSKTKRTRCKEVSELTTPWSETRAGCIQSGSPCLMAKIKKNWEEAHLPIKDLDSNIQFCQTLSVNADPLDLFDQSLLLDMIFLGTPQLRGGVNIFFFTKCPLRNTLVYTVGR